MQTFADALDKLDEALLILQNANTFDDMNLDSDSVSDFHYLARRCEDFIECYSHIVREDEGLHI